MPWLSHCLCPDNVRSQRWACSPLSGTVGVFECMPQRATKVYSVPKYTASQFRILCMQLEGRRYRIGNSHKAPYSAERCHKVQQNWMPVCSCVVRLAVIAEANTLQSRMQVKGTAISATTYGSTEYCCSCTWEVRGGSTKQTIQQSSTLLRVQLKGTTTYSSTRYSFARGCSR